MPTKLNITPGPWVKSGFRAIGTTNTFNGENVDVIFDTFFYSSPVASAAMGKRIEHYLSECEANSTAIVTAVNNTYHAGINPEAVPEMLEALKLVSSSLLSYEGVGDESAELKFAILTIQKATL